MVGTRCGASSGQKVTNSKNIDNMKGFYIALAFFSAGLPLMAQGSIEDYQRAFDAPRRFGASNVFYSNVRPSWINDGCFWYVREKPDGREYVKVDAKSRRRTPLFDHSKLAKSLSDASGKDMDSAHIDLGWMRVSPKADTLSFSRDGMLWKYAVKSGKLISGGPVPKRPEEPHWMVVDDEKGLEPVASPDGSKTAFIRNGNVYVRDNASGEERAVSVDGTDGNYYSSWIYWSPDGKKLAVNKIRPAEKRYVYYVESSPSDQLQPKLHKQEYAKPGDELRHKVPTVFNLATGESFSPAPESIASQYDIYGPEWNDDSSAVVFDYNARGHKTYSVYELSATDGNLRTLVAETHDKYVNYPRIFRHMLSDGRRMIWASERDNYNHLYMYDRSAGSPMYQITKGEWYVREVLKVDEANGRIFFSANGVDSGEDPYNIKYYSIGLDGTGMTCLTPGSGYHSATFSPDMSYLVDVVSSPTEAPVATLRSGADGVELMRVETADISRLLEAGWRAPEVFYAPGRDGKTPIWGIIQRPSNFDPSKKYPVIEYIYSGPGDQYVPKTFYPCYYWTQPLAELGFIVVMSDGMSTSFRSREFENVCYKNLKDAGIPDHIAWLKAAAEKYPEIDIDNVGIYGCSAGGQESTSAVLLHPEFYKAAYSACGCHDNRMDKIWWNELWMGYPVDKSYEECSNVVNAHLLERPLMLVVGELDDNVDPASTMQVADALIKAGKDFELVVIPGAHHTMGEAFGDHKRYDFFVRHLMNRQPPKWSDIKQ